jgi:hypothetical protein
MLGNSESIRCYIQTLHDQLPVCREDYEKYIHHFFSKVCDTSYILCNRLNDGAYKATVELVVESGKLSLWGVGGTEFEAVRDALNVYGEDRDALLPTAIQQ